MIVKRATAVGGDVMYTYTPCKVSVGVSFVCTTHKRPCGMAHGAYVGSGLHVSLSLSLSLSPYLSLSVT